MINIQSDQIMAGPRVITTAKKQKTKLDLMSMQRINTEGTKTNETIAQEKHDSVAEMNNEYMDERMPGMRWGLTATG